MPLSCLLVETDSPVLGTTAGMRNEPANAVKSLEMIARIKNIHPRAVAEAVVEIPAGCMGNGCCEFKRKRFEFF